MFGRILGKILAAPVRIINLPLKVLETLVDDEHQNALDDAAATIEKEASKILDEK